MQKTKSTQDDIFIGLMSGTSVDGIDAAALRFPSEGSIEILETYSHEIPNALRDKIITLNSPSDNELHKVMTLDIELGELFAEATLQLLQKAKLASSDIKAIGSHGQTIRHQVDTEPRYTLQIGNPNVIAIKTGITTISDFRQADVYLGGQGAPLAPGFHNAVFRASHEERVILNIGGFANITLLGSHEGELATGFDTGPGNVLLNTWIKQNKGLDFDNEGEWAKSGKNIDALLARLMQESFINQAPPKSTGRDLFNASWLEKQLARFQSSETAEDIQATILEYTVASISEALKKWGPKSGSVYVCGGGAHNTHLMKRLKERLPLFTIQTTEALGLHPDWVEASAFAWLAKQRLNNHNGNLPSVTGASQASQLGGIYQQNIR